MKNKQIILAVLLAIASITAMAQDDTTKTVNYTQPTLYLDTINYAQPKQCSDSISDATGQALAFSLEKDTMHITGSIIANCCATPLLVIEQKIDSLLLTRLDTGNVCDTCYCLYNIDVEIPHCYGSEYRVVLKKHWQNDSIDTLITTKDPTPYISCFGDSTTQWNVVIHGTCYGPNCYDTYMCNINAKDTLHKNGKIYYLIDSYGSFEYLYQNEDNSKLWYYNDKEKKETLLMDMSLQLGDTFKLKDIYYYGKNVIAVVDSIYYKNGQKIIRTDLIYYLPNTVFGFMNLTFIEGIGSNVFIALDNFNQDNNVFSCQFRNDTLYYQYELSKECYVDWMTIDKIKTENQKPYLFTYDTENKLAGIEFEQETDAFISLISIHGQTLLTEKVQQCRSHKLNLQEFDSGVYLIQIVINNKNYSEKIIVKK